MSSKNRKSKTKNKSSSSKETTSKIEWTDDDDSDDEYDDYYDDMYQFPIPRIMMEHCMNSALGLQHLDYSERHLLTMYDNNKSREHGTTSKQMASKSQVDKSPCQHPIPNMDLTACDANKIAQKYNYESFGRKHNSEINEECDTCKKHKNLNSVEPSFKGMSFISTTDGNESDETEASDKLLFYEGWQKKESKMKIVQSVFNKKTLQENIQERSNGEFQNVDSMFADLYGTSKKKKKKNTAVAALAIALQKTSDTNVATNTPSTSKDTNVPKVSIKNVVKSSAENMKPDDNSNKFKTSIVEEKIQLILNFQAAVREGTEFFLKSEFSRCVDIYKRVRKDFAEVLRNICSLQDRSLFTYVFCLSRSLSHSYEEIIDSLHDLKVDLPASFPLRLYGLALTYQRLNRHATAMPHLRAALDSSPGPSAQTLYYPYCYCRYLADTVSESSNSSSKKEPTKKCACTLVPIPESNPDLLKARLESMHRDCSMPRPATARCKYADCLKISTHEVPSQLIYTTDPDFSGYVRVWCEERCRIDYHHQCWKAYKESTLDIGVKISDKDFLGKDCPTDGCKTGHNSTSCIVKINIHGADNEIKSSQTKPSTGVLATGGGKKSREDEDDKAATSVGKKKRNRMDSAESSPLRTKSKKKEPVMSEKSKKKEASAKRKDVAEESKQEDEKSKEAEEEAQPRKKGKHRKVKYSCVDSSYPYHGQGESYKPMTSAAIKSQRKNPQEAARDFLFSLEEELEVLQVLRLSRHGVPDEEWTDVSQDWLGNEPLVKDQIINERYTRTLSPGEELVFDIYRCHLKETQGSLKILEDHWDRKKTFWNLSWTPDGEILPSLDKIGGFKTISQFLTSSSEFVIIGSNLSLAENVASCVEAALPLNDLSSVPWWSDFLCLTRYNDDKDSDRQILVHLPRGRQVDHSKLQAHFSMFGPVKLMSAAMVKAEGTSLYICCPQDPGSIWSDSTSEIIDPHSNEVLVTFNNPATVRTALQYSKYDVNPVCSFGNHLYCSRENKKSDANSGVTTPSLSNTRDRFDSSNVENFNVADTTILHDFEENAAQLVSVEKEFSVSNVESETESAASVTSYDEGGVSYDEDDVTSIETDAENIDSVKDTLCDETENINETLGNETENVNPTKCDKTENSLCNKTENVDLTHSDKIENVEETLCNKTENVEETLCDETEDVEETLCDETENVEEALCDETEIIEETLCDETENVEETLCDETENVEEALCDETENIEETLCDQTKNVEETLCDETENVEETLCDQTENVEETLCDETENVVEALSDQTENVEETLCDQTENVKETLCDQTENIGETCDKTENIHDTLSDKSENLKDNDPRDKIYDEVKNIVKSSCGGADTNFEHKLCDEAAKDTSIDEEVNKVTMKNIERVIEISVANDQIEDGEIICDVKENEALPLVCDIDEKIRKCFQELDNTAKCKQQVDNNPDNKFSSLDNDLLSTSSESNLCSNKIAEIVVNSSNNFPEIDSSKADLSNEVYSKNDHRDVFQTHLLETEYKLRTEKNIDQTKQPTDPTLINESNITEDISDELVKTEIKETQFSEAPGSSNNRDPDTIIPDQTYDQPTIESSNATAEKPFDSTSEELIIRNQYLNEIKSALKTLSENEKNKLLCKVEKWSDQHGKTDDDQAISGDESDSYSSDDNVNQTVIQPENTAKSGEFLHPPFLELTNASVPEFTRVTSNRDIPNTSNHVNIPEFESQASTSVTLQEFPQTCYKFTPWGNDSSSESEYFDDFVEDLPQSDPESTLDIDCERNENYLDKSAMQKVEEYQNRTEELLSCDDNMEFTAHLSNDMISHPQPQRICKYKLDSSSSDSAKLAPHEIISNLEEEIKNLKRTILESRKSHCDFILQSQSEQCLSKLAQWDIFRTVFGQEGGGERGVWRRLDREEAEWETRMRRAREQAEEVKREYNVHLTSLHDLRGADIDFSLLRRPRQELMFEDTSMTRYEQLYQSVLTLHIQAEPSEQDDSSENSDSEDSNHERKSTESLDAIIEDQMKSSSVETEKLFSSNEKLLEVLDEGRKSSNDSSNVHDETHNETQNLSLLSNKLGMTNTTVSDTDNETANNKEIEILHPRKDSVIGSDSARKTDDSNRAMTDDGIESTKRDDLVTLVEPKSEDKLMVKSEGTNSESCIPVIASSSKDNSARQADATSIDSGRGESESKTATERNVVDGEPVSGKQLTFPKDDLAVSLESATEDIGNVKTEAAKTSSDLSSKNAISTSSLEKYANVSTSNAPTTITCSTITSAVFNPSQSSITGSMISATGNTATAARNPPALPPMNPQRMQPVPANSGTLPCMPLTYPPNFYQPLPCAYPQQMQLAYNGYNPNMRPPFPMQSTFTPQGPSGFMPIMSMYPMFPNQPVPPSSPIRAQGSHQQGPATVVQATKPGNTDVKASSSASSRVATPVSQASNTVYPVPNAPYHPPSIYYQGYSLVQPTPPLAAGYSTHPSQSNVSLPAPSQETKNYFAGLSNEKTTSNVAPTVKQSIDKLNEKVDSVGVNKKSTAEHSIDSVRTEKTNESVATGSQVSAEVYKFLENFLDNSKAVPKVSPNHESNVKPDMKNNYEVKVNLEEVKRPDVEKNNTAKVKAVEKKENEPNVDTDYTNTKTDDKTGGSETALNFEQDNISQLLSGFLGNLTESSSKNIRKTPKTIAPRTAMRKTMVVKKKPKSAEMGKNFCLSDILTDFSKLCGDIEEPEVSLKQDPDSDEEDEDRRVDNKKTAFPMSRPDLHHKNQYSRKNERARTSSERSNESASSNRSWRLSQQSNESNSCETTVKTKQLPKRSMVHLVNTRVKEETPQASTEAGSSGWTEVVRRNLGIKPTPLASAPVSQSGSKSCGQRLLEHLTARFPSESTESLTALVRSVRKKHGSRLTGLSFELIETEVRLQLTRSQHQARDQDSASSGWEKFKGKAWGDTKAVKPAQWQSSCQEECVICFFQLGMRTTVLACQHVFHTECIKKWLKEKSVCPCCQKFTTLNEEYPPL